MSKRRVGDIVSNIKFKWGVTSRVEVGILAYKNGFLDS